MLRGVSWTAVSQVLSQLATIATTVILARLLMPSDFGVVGMAALYTGLVAMLGQIGMGAALIHRQDVGQTELDTVFWTGIAVGSVIALVSVVLASARR
jgi:teichuronic acid exporter